MIDFRVEALLELIGESFSRGIVAVHVLVANRAHRNIRRGELCQVTTGTRLVTGEVRTRRIVSAPVTVVATDRCVFRTGVQEFRVILRGSEGKSKKEKGKKKVGTEPRAVASGIRARLMPRRSNA